ncbi:MAG: peptidoglycan glycosyltransferase, partial [Opitutales bacterium]|nr:peptidoglycan glycosyltransferase [Opitutales bacterium]
TNKPRYSAVLFMHDVNEEISSIAKKIRADRRAALARGETLPNPLPNSKRVAQGIVLGKYIDVINSILGSNYKFSQKEFERHEWQHRLLPFPLIKDLSAKEHAILSERLPINSPIQIYTSSSRYYPHGETAAHVLGYVTSNFDNIDVSGIPGEELRTSSFAGEYGKSGVEKAFNEDLAGANGAKIWVVDHLGYQYESILDITAKKGKSLSLSIDLNIQDSIEDAFGSRKGAAVVLDVKTGEVLAMASRPCYNLNSLTPYISYAVSNEITENGAWLNRATQGLYPPGSTFKIVTSIAALQDGAIAPETVKTCSGGMKIGRRIFPCHKRSGHGNLDLIGAIANSCNTYFYSAGIDSKITSIHKTAEMLGLNANPNIELSENYWHRTIVPTPEYKRKNREFEGGWSMGDTANTSIGQGYLRQTPLQIACMVASIAGKRTRTKASIVHDENRITDLAYHQAKPLPISEKNYKAIVDGMIAAVQRGTCKRAAIEYAQVAAKSGTAQVTSHGKKLDLAWMIAFAPVENPEVAMCVVVEGEEVGDVGGGRTAGPIVNAAMKTYFETRTAK